MKRRLVPAGAVEPGDIGLIAAHAVRNGAGTKFILRKGDVLTEAHLSQLRALGDRELHLVGVEEDELHEAQAGARLARAISGPGIDLRGPAESQYTLLARQRGLLRVDAERLFAVNSLDGISVLTRFDHQPVDAGDELAGAKVTPLVMPSATIEEVERICREGPPLRVLPFKPMRVAALVLERVDQRSRDRFQAALEHKLAWFGSELVAVGEAPSGDRYVQVLRDVLESGPDLIMAAGASSLDPLEPLFGALDAVGAQIVKHGVPVHPGSLFWIAYVGPVPLFGLSSCEMFSHRTILDLVLPRLFAGEPIGRDDLARLGHGGMLGREMAFRFPPYGARDGTEA
ncbi:MAG TPA: hypothetical protein VFH48_08195 [Chloroflexota bacterium]|nr:hypothetical protein [Chloroflexota bacterium]